MIQDLKTEIETIKKMQTQGILKTENMDKYQEITNSNINRSLISLNINALNSPIKRHRLTDWI